MGEDLEDGKNLDSTIEESLGVEETVCIESVFRNWRDPTLHSNRLVEFGRFHQNMQKREVGKWKQSIFSDLLTFAQETEKEISW